MEIAATDAAAMAGPTVAGGRSSTCISRSCADRPTAADIRGRAMAEVGGARRATVAGMRAHPAVEATLMEVEVGMPAVEADTPVAAVVATEAADIARRKLR